MAESRVFTLRGEVPVSDLSRVVNGVLSVVHSHLRVELTQSPLVFVPDAAVGAVVTVPDMRESAVCESGLERQVLSAESGCRLFGFSPFNIGRRLAFRVGGMHLTIGRRELGWVTAGVRADFELTYRDDDEQWSEVVRWLGRVDNQETLKATESEAQLLAE